MRIFSNFPNLLFPDWSYLISRNFHVFNLCFAGKCIADIVSLFITIMDKLRLGIRAMDELNPELRDLVDTMNRLSIISESFEGKAKVKSWLETLNSMQASDELSDDQVRQFLFDLESAYSAFNNLLHQS